MPFGEHTDLKHLMAVMLLTRLARKAAMVVREVTSMETRACLRVALTLENIIIIVVKPCPQTLSPKTP